MWPVILLSSEMGEDSFATNCPQQGKEAQPVPRGEGREGWQTRGPPPAHRSRVRFWSSAPTGRNVSWMWVGCFHQSRFSERGWCLWPRTCSASMSPPPGSHSGSHALGWWTRFAAPAGSRQQASLDSLVTNLCPRAYNKKPNGHYWP